MTNRPSQTPILANGHDAFQFTVCVLEADAELQSAFPA